MLSGDQFVRQLAFFDDNFTAFSGTVGEFLTEKNHYIMELGQCLPEVNYALLWLLSFKEQDQPAFILFCTHQFHSGAVKFSLLSLNKHNHCRYYITPVWRRTSESGACTSM